jgi:hypothetical protein
MRPQANRLIFAPVENGRSSGSARLSNDERTSFREAEDNENAREPKAVPMQPGRSQRQRSKLNQAAEPAPPAAPAPAPPPSPLQQETSDEQSIPRKRLKRSGQLRDDLLRPPDSQPKKADDLY